MVQQVHHEIPIASWREPSYVTREEHEELKNLLKEFSKDRLEMKATIEELEARVDFLEDRLEYVEAITRKDGTQSQVLECLIMYLCLLKNNFCHFTYDFFKCRKHATT